MQNMFHGKFVIIIEVQPIIEHKVVIDVNVVDVNVITSSSQLKNKCLRIESQGKQKMILTKRKNNN